MNSTNAPRKRSTRLVLISAAALALCVLIGGVLLSLSGSGDDAGRHATFVVERGPLTIAVSEAGTIQARDQVVLKNEVEGRSTIIYLIEEGTRVEEGELLVELDSSELQNELVEHQIRVQNAEAEFIRARENLAVIESQARSDIADAELGLQFAGEDLIKYTEGEYPRQLKQAQAKITLAREELDRADEKLKWSERLHEQKYISQTELETDRLARSRRALELELAVDELELLEKYTYKRQLAQLKSDVEQAEMALDRVKRRAASDVVQAKADLRAKESEYDREKERLAKVEDQIRKCRIEAPRAGMVIYATTGRANNRGNDEPLAEGREVREREELILLPTEGSMMAEVKVHESSLQKVRVGQPVRLTVDALPGRVYTGKVTKIAPLPDAQSVWMNPDLKVYATEIVLSDATSELRTGMTCMAQIIVDNYLDAVYVPVHTVVRVENQPTVFVAGKGEPEPRAVTLGSDNNRMVRILDGLQPGERVLQNPPLSAGRVAVGVLSNVPGEVAEEASQEHAAPPEKPARKEPLAAADRPRRAPARVE